MSEELTLPGAIPGLLRRGSPVLIPVAPPRVMTLGLKAVFLGCGIDHDGLLVARMDAAPTWEAPEDVALWLEDATGRAHAAWWVGEQVKTRGNLYNRIDSSPQLYRHMPHRKRSDAHRYLAMYIRGEAFTDRQPPRSEAVKPDHVVPALADLDPDDPRLLTDGSRYVDALALKLVVLHVAGVPRG